MRNKNDLLEAVHFLTANPPSLPWTLLELGTEAGWSSASPDALPLLFDFLTGGFVNATLGLLDISLQPRLQSWGLSNQDVGV
jgi:hypothetical protein